MQDYLMDDYGYYNSLKRGWEKLKALEDPLEDKITVFRENYDGSIEVC